MDRLEAVVATKAASILGVKELVEVQVVEGVEAKQEMGFAVVTA